MSDVVEKKNISPIVRKEVNNKRLNEIEQNTYNILFNNILEDANLYKPSDLMLLDVLCFDYVRIKRIQKMIAEQGEFYIGKTREGVELPKVRDFSYLLNSINASFRSSMKELMLSRKSRVKQIGKDSTDFSKFMEEHVIDMEVKKDDKAGNSNNKDKKK